MPRDYAMPFSDHLGVELVEVTPERVVARLKVRPELCTRPAVLHGGAVMALADTLGGVATVANLGQGQWTTTIESKTNFLAAIPEGEVATAECMALHRGKTTMVWQTKITREDGRVAAYVTQTQLVLSGK
jgi:1,4-dihydroxy-2-naphthoyl-CoA hydrolase